MRSRLFSMLLTGLILAILFLVAVQLFQSVRSRIAGVEANPNNQSSVALPDSYLPVIIQSVSESDNTLFVSGTSEPDASISIQNFGNNIRQFKSDPEGNWNVNFDINPDERLKIEFVEFVMSGSAIRSGCPG